MKSGRLGSFPSLAQQVMLRRLLEVDVEVALGTSTLPLPATVPASITIGKPPSATGQGRVWLPHGTLLTACMGIFRSGQGQGKAAHSRKQNLSPVRRVCPVMHHPYRGRLEVAESSPGALRHRRTDEATHTACFIGSYTHTTYIHKHKYSNVQILHGTHRLAPCLSCGTPVLCHSPPTAGKAVGAVMRRQGSGGGRGPAPLSSQVPPKGSVL